MAAVGRGRSTRSQEQEDDIRSLGLSVTDLVRMTGFSRNTIQNYLAGKPVRDHTAAAIRNVVLKQKFDLGLSAGIVVAEGRTVSTEPNNPVAALSGVVVSSLDYRRTSGMSPLEPALTALKQATNMFQSATEAAIDDEKLVSPAFVKKLKQQIDHLLLYHQTLSDLASKDCAP